MADLTQDVLFVWVPSCWESALPCRAVLCQGGLCVHGLFSAARGHELLGQHRHTTCARHGDSRDDVLPLLLGKVCTDPGA